MEEGSEALEEQYGVEARGASIAMAVVRHVPVDGLVILIAQYEKLWIPPILYPMERFYRRLNDRLMREIYEEFPLRVCVGGDCMTAKIVSIDFTAGKNNVALTVLTDETKRHLVEPFAANLFNRGGGFTSLAPDGIYFEIDLITQTVRSPYSTRK